MNEKKAIVFFFFVVFFCFSFLLLVVVVVTSTYVTYVFLSPSLPLSCCVLFVSVCSSSPPWRTLTCVCFARLVYVCVCAAVCLSISTFCCRCCCFRFFFRGPHCASNAALLAHLVSSLTFVIRGGVFLHFFFAAAAACIEQNTHVQTRTQHTHRRTDGFGRKGEKCARAASFGKHTQNYFTFFYCCVLLLLL